MTTAREQAKQNVHHELGMHSPDVHDFMDECANAASDVWEPLLRDLIAEMERAMTHLTQMHSAVLRRAKEALGE